MSKFSAILVLTLAAIIHAPISNAALWQSLNGDQLVVATDQANLGATLTVMAPDMQSWRKTLPAGSEFQIDLRRVAGKDRLASGQYLYEISLIPNEGGTAAKAMGAFSVVSGSVINSNVVEQGTGPGSTQGSTQGALKDTEISDDLLAGDNLCVGLDCFTGMDFGLDRIIVQSNNLRLYFNDTSSSSSFPNRDWRLIANDSNNGGANYFAIEDATAANQVFRISAGAPESSLTVAPNGDVGVGTLTAQQDMHVVRGDSPTLRLDQDASGGYSPQVWDVGGNESQFYVRNSSASDAIPFRILPNAISGLLTVGDATSPNRVTVDGEFYIGTDQVTPDYVFEPGFNLMSISEHQQAMLEGKHLPYVGAAQRNEDGKYVINVSQRSQGLLKELEIAHLYIAELHTRLEAMEKRLEALER